MIGTTKVGSVGKIRETRSTNSADDAGGVIEAEVAVPVLKLKFSIGGPPIKEAVLSTIECEVVPIADVATSGGVCGGPVHINHPFHLFAPGILSGLDLTVDVYVVVVGRLDELREGCV